MVVCFCGFSRPQLQDYSAISKHLCDLVILAFLELVEEPAPPGWVTATQWTCYQHLKTYNLKLVLKGSKASHKFGNRRVISGVRAAEEYPVGFLSEAGNTSAK